MICHIFTLLTKAAEFACEVFKKRKLMPATKIAGISKLD
jgi:hypothetical protein